MGNIARLVDDAGDAVRQTIRAYHGSPRPTHFDRFDSSHIGTGEGAQAYGHGMYFAGNRDVADDYRRSLSVKEFQRRFDQAGIPQDADFDEVMEAMEAFDPRQQELLRRLNEEGFLGFDYPAQAISESLKRGMPTRYEVSPEFIRARDQVGTGYEVEIGVPESSLLDWDAPLSSQPHVLEALRKVSGRSPTQSGGANLQELVENYPGNTAGFVELMGEKYMAPGWPHATRGGAAVMAEALFKEGVPGIRYLDQGSRRAGSGTRNYVMFPGTEDKIRILSKYAVPPLIAAGMQGEDR